MKKVILSIFALGTILTANAQKGTLLVGGNIDYSSSSTKQSGSGDSTQSLLDFSPKVGYQINDHITLGLEAGIGSFNYNNGGNGSTTPKVEQSGSRNSFGVFGRYAQAIDKTFSFYGDLGIGTQSRDFKTVTTIPFIGSNTTTSPSESGMYVQFTPALFVNFKNSFGLNFSVGGLGYGKLGDNSGFNVSFGKSVSVGISKNFGL